MFEGKKVAFIASGGGGRGIAHGGVMKACEELGIKIDMVIGASAGAIFAAFYGQNQSAERLIDLFRPSSERKFNLEFGWKNMISLKNFFSPNMKTGLFDLAGAEEYFARTLAINDFRELNFPIYVSATNLRTDSGELFGPGFNDHVPISKVVAASCCVPVIFRPMKIGNDYYIDGEIKRPTAVNTACELGADIVIVSDSYKPETKGIESSNMFNIASQMASMLLEDKSMRGIKIARSRFPDKEIILISPNLGKISAFNTYAWKKLSDLGYEEAMNVLQEYKLERAHG